VARPAFITPVMSSENMFLAASERGTSRAARCFWLSAGGTDRCMAASWLAVPSSGFGIGVGRRRRWPRRVAAFTWLATSAALSHLGTLCR